MTERVQTPFNQTTIADEVIKGIDRLVKSWDDPLYALMNNAGMMGFQMLPGGSGRSVKPH